MKLLSTRDCEVIARVIDHLFDVLAPEDLEDYHQLERIRREIDEALASQYDPIDNWYREQAEGCSREGECEIDDGTIVSRCALEDACGAYVQSWTWVKGPAPQQWEQFLDQLVALAEEMGITAEQINKEWVCHWEDLPFRDLLRYYLEDWGDFDINSWKEGFQELLDKKEDVG